MMSAPSTGRSRRLYYPRAHIPYYETRLVNPRTCIRKSSRVARLQHRKKQMFTPDTSNRQPSLNTIGDADLYGISDANPLTISEAKLSTEPGATSSGSSIAGSDIVPHFTWLTPSTWLRMQSPQLQHRGQSSNSPSIESSYGLPH